MQTLWVMDAGSALLPLGCCQLVCASDRVTRLPRRACALIGSVKVLQDAQILTNGVAERDERENRDCLHVCQLP